MLKASDYKPGDPIYTFVDNKGKNYHIDSHKLREWVVNQSDLEIQLVPVDDDKVNHMIKNNCVNINRVFQLADECVAGKRKLDPIIFCKTGTQTNSLDDVMLVDGHHRYTLCAMFKLETVPCILLEISQWSLFQIEGCIDIDHETLRAMPVNGNRNY